MLKTQICVTRPQYVKNTMSLQVVKYICCVFSCSLKVFGDPESKSIFELQERVVQLISNVGRYTLCRELFKALNELLVPCMCISGIVCYMKINIDNLEQNIEICHHNTCHDVWVSTFISAELVSLTTV